MTSLRFAAASRRRVLFCGLILCAGGCLPGSVGSARAQSDAGSYIHGSGGAVVEQLPDVMRVHVQMTARGSTLAEALAALKDRREAAVSVLPTMGATADSIKVADPEVTRGEDQQRMNQMIMERMGRTKRGAAATTAKPPTTATAVLTADFPLESDDVEKLLAEVDALQEKIKAADLGGAKEAAQLTPEEEELQAELQQYGSGNQETNPGEPQFLYVSKIDEERRAKLTAEAFAKAEQNAQQLAAAAGAKLGKLKSLSGSARPGGVDEGLGSYGNNPYYYELQRSQYQFLQSMMSGNDGSSGEAFGVKPGKVKFAVQVQASFELE